MDYSKKYDFNRFYDNNVKKDVIKDRVKNAMKKYIDDIFLALYGDKRDTDEMDKLFSEVYRWEVDNIVEDIENFIIYNYINKQSITCRVFANFIGFVEYMHIGNEAFYSQRNEDLLVTTSNCILHYIFEGDSANIPNVND